MRLAFVVLVGLAVLAAVWHWGTRPPDGQAATPGPTRQAGATSPQDAVSAYLAAMAEGEASPDLAIYTPASRDMMRGRAMAPAQMRALSAAYRRCRADKVVENGARAVVRYPASARECAPFVLSRGAQGWQIDLVFMSRRIGFDGDNAWHFTAGVPAEVRFAFDGWRFDARGYPQP